LLLIIVMIFVVVANTGLAADKPAEDVKATTVSSNSVVINFLSWIVYWLVVAAGWIFSWVLALMLWVTSYNDFLREPVVVYGWKIVRDLCNNFFIVILLVIAVATTLRIQSYHYKQLLTRLLVFAVLINFSKLFAGLLIDLSQIIMLTFANSLASGEAYALFLHSLHLTELLKLGEVEMIAGAGDKLKVDSLDIFVALIFALIITVVAVVVVLIVTIVLVFRIIMLWFLIILSPLAFLANTFPRAQAYYARWWSEFFKYLIVGPVMVFFIYLSFFALEKMAADTSSKGTDFSTAKIVKNPLESGSKKFSSTELEKIGGLSEIATVEGMFNFMIVIGLLVGSLVVAQEAGVAGGQYAAKGIQKMKGIASKPVNWGQQGLGWGAKKAWSGAKTGVVGGTKMASTLVGMGTKKILKGAGATEEGAATATRVMGDVAKGTAAGAAIGSVVGPVGTFAGAGFGALAGGANEVRKWVTKKWRNYNPQETKRFDAHAKGDNGELMHSDGKTKLVEDGGIYYHADDMDKDKKHRKKADVEKGEVTRWDEDSAGYRAIDKGDNFYDDAFVGADALHDESPRLVNPINGKPMQVPVATMHDGDGKKIIFLDKDKNKVDRREDAKYELDDAANGGIGGYREVDDKAKRLVGNDGLILSRYGDVEHTDGSHYRRTSEDGTYYKREADGTLELDENGERITGETALRGGKGKFKAMSGGLAALRLAYEGAFAKGPSVGDAAEAKNIEEAQTKYKGQSSDILQELLKVEGSRVNKMAIAMTLALKNGFKKAEQVHRARDSFGGNKLLTGQFNDELVKKNLVLAHTTKSGDINEGAINKDISTGKVKWSDQDTSKMDGRAFEIMAKNTGIKFAKEVDSMIKTVKDKVNVSKAMESGLENRGFSGADLQIRKMFGAISGGFEKAFTDADKKVHESELQEAMSKISKPEIFGKVGSEDMKINTAFSKNFAKAITPGMLKKMERDLEISGEQFRRFITMVRAHNKGLFDRVNTGTFATSLPNEAEMDAIAKRDGVTLL